MGTDKELLLAVCKFVDTALILLPQTFQIFKWSFIRVQNFSNGMQSEPPSPFIPHLQLLAKRLEQQRQSEENLDEEEEEKKEKMFGSGLSEFGNKKRPILPMRKIRSVYE